jgi:hypothetical protein
MRRRVHRCSGEEVVYRHANASAKVKGDQPKLDLYYVGCGGPNSSERVNLSSVDMNHPLAKLARAIDWGFLEKRFGAVYSDKPGQSPLPTRLWRASQS